MSMISSQASNIKSGYRSRSPSQFHQRRSTVSSVAHQKIAQPSRLNSIISNTETIAFNFPKDKLKLNEDGSLKTDQHSTAESENTNAKKDGGGLFKSVLLSNIKHSVKNTFLNAVYSFKTTEKG